MSVAPPRPKGPPLNALRAFEAAARWGGFTGAAEELHVTPGAIAQQVRALEEWAGAPLFSRHAQGVTLTKLGIEAASAYGAAFDALGAATNSLRAGATPGAAHIATLPGIAQLWLSHRMEAIRRDTGIVLSVSAIETPPNLNRTQYDLTLFYEAADGAADVINLGEDAIFPVCAPKIAARIRRDGLSGETWLTDAAWPDDWSVWMGEKTIAQGPVFSLYALALGEAMSGAGVLMGHRHLVQKQIADGTLVAPFERVVPTGRCLTLSVAAGAGSITREIAAHLEKSQTTP